MKRRSFIKSIFAVLAIPFVPILKPKPKLTATEVLMFEAESIIHPPLLDIEHEEWKMLANAFTEYTLKQWESFK